MSDYVHGGVHQSVDLTCVVHSNPSAEVTWFKMRGSQKEQIRNVQHSESMSETQIHNLTLKNIQKSDFGKYLCSAVNMMGSHSKGMELSGRGKKSLIYIRMLAIIFHILVYNSFGSFFIATFSIDGLN